MFLENVVLETDSSIELFEFGCYFSILVSPAVKSLVSVYSYLNLEIVAWSY